jgi:HEPN domain-containing protein
VADDRPIYADDWATMALEERSVAEVLALEGRWKQAFSHAGFAVECALKYAIMKIERLNEWPPRQARRELYSHDLSRLLEIAGLRDHLLDEVDLQSRIGLAWLVAKDWSIETRYDPLPFPPPRGKDMLDAITKSGLLEWLMKQKSSAP